MRHARAEPYADADIDRPLTARGRAEAAATGRRLGELGWLPDHALVSAAARAVATWEEVRSAAGAEHATVELSEAVYGASPGAILETLRLRPPSAGTVIFIGHNPAAGDLVHLLDDGDGDPDLLRGMLQGFPTAAVAGFELPGDWEALDEGTARLTHFHVGRG